ncbi:uncharacterized protein AC631_00841 [Debaryomyces fabryi]|uniref:Aminotransferase class V domain-containing protein n=1 Tax=Debaryomyces fabryi TaxID=58627 RepID=A0A0V1Q4K2_9ASCO|nr:uncharacterized protein AC631_00841 [Debaryomyces fabryi]KSA03356.1 hypothetical protein AC631_00841 [Debaryomyces fabryi]CUM49915.1 unnamed protein product [Debaryomyces fabryi]
MTSARERLAMLHSHIKDNSNIRLLAEFPMLVQSERQQYLNSNFQSVPGNANSSYFASSVMRQTNKPVMSISSLKSNNRVFQCSSQQDNSEINASKSISSTTKSFSNLEFDEICTNVDKKLRLLLGNNSPCDSYILSGKESLGWDFLGSNIVKSLDDDILCISTGFYSKQFAEHLQKYVESEERKVTVLEAKIGHTVSLELIKNELTKKRYGIIVLTHTDNSTGVVTNIEEVSQLVKQISPSTLIVVDTVYSAGVEEIQVDNWGIDFTLSTYQSSIFTTEVLSYILLSSRAVLKIPEVLVNDSRSSNNNKIQLTYSEEIFQLLTTLNDSLQRLFGIDDQQDISFTISSTLQSKLLSRFSDYKLAARKLRKTLVNEENGITTISEDWSNCSNGMTVVYFPKTIESSELLRTLSEECDICLINGTHPRIASEYISIEHAGFRFSGNDIDVDKVIKIIQKCLANCK